AVDGNFITDFEPFYPVFDTRRRWSSYCCSTLQSRWLERIVWRLSPSLERLPGDTITSHVLDDPTFAAAGAHCSGAGRRLGVRASAAPPEAEAIIEGSCDPRLDVVPRAVTQRRVDRDKTEPDASSAAGLGIPEGHRLFVTGRGRRPSRIDAPRAERRDRRVSR